MRERDTQFIAIGGMIFTFSSVASQFQPFLAVSGQEAYARRHGDLVWLREVIKPRMASVRVYVDYRG